MERCECGEAQAELRRAAEILTSPRRYPTTGSWSEVTGFPLKGVPTSPDYMMNRLFSLSFSRDQPEGAVRRAKASEESLEG